MNANLKIGTWNLCLGLPYKKDLVTDYLKSKNRMICCLQETEIPFNFPVTLLDCGDLFIYLFIYLLGPLISTIVNLKRRPLIPSASYSYGLVPLRLGY